MKLKISRQEVQSRDFVPHLVMPEVRTFRDITRTIGSTRSSGLYVKLEGSVEGFVIYEGFDDNKLTQRVFGTQSLD